jgi:hypothetical protein
MMIARSILFMQSVKLNIPVSDDTLDGTGSCMVPKVP